MSQTVSITLRKQSISQAVKYFLIQNVATFAHNYISYEAAVSAEYLCETEKETRENPNLAT